MKTSKNLLAAVILWGLTVSICLAQSSIGPEQRWVVQVDGSYTTPAFGNFQRLRPAYGEDINVGYRFNRTFSLLLGTGYCKFSMPFAPDATHLSYVPVAGFLRVTVGHHRIHPYVILGLGAVFNNFTQTDPLQSPSVRPTKTEINFYMAPGLGIMYVFSKKGAIFIQSRMDVDFTSFNGFGIPMGSPSVFIPVQVGLSLFTH